MILRNVILAVPDSVTSGQKSIPSSQTRGVTYCSGLFPSLFLLLLALVAISPRAEAQTAQFSFAKEAIGGSQFINPADVAVDAAGNVYVADTASNLVQEIPASCIGGKNDATCVVTLPGSFSGPQGVAVDAAGNVYVADTGNGAIKEIPANCKQSDCVVELTRGLNSPEGIAVAANGNIYVADTGNNAVKEITANCASQCVQTLVEPTKLPGYNAPTALTFDKAGNLYVADTGNNRVLELTGACTTSSNCNFNTNGVSGLAFSSPRGVAVDAAGDLFVSATNDNAIVELPSGCTSAQCQQDVVFGLSGNLMGLAIDHSGNLYVANQADSQVQMFQTHGVKFDTEPIGSTTDQTLTFLVNAIGSGSGVTLASPLALTEGAKNQDFTVDPNDPGTCVSGDTIPSWENCTVHVLFTPKYPGPRRGSIALTTQTGTILAEANVYGTGVGPQVAWNNPSATASTATQLGIGWSRPTGIAVDGAGNVFVADNFNDTVEEVPPGCQAQQCMKTLGGGFRNPWGIAVDGADNVYVADTLDNEVKEIPAGCTSASCVETLGGNFSQPMDVAVDLNGNVYVADYQDNEVQEIPAGCTATDYTNKTCSPITLGGGFMQPASVAVDSAGNVYEADNNATALNEIPLSCIDGKNDASCVETLVGGFGKVRKMALDSAGDIYVTDAGANAANSSSVQEIPVGCTTHSCVKELVSGLNVAEGLALDDAGNLYIADSYGNLALEVVRNAPPTLSFANTKVGQSSSDSPQSVEMENIGNAVLNFPVPTSGLNPSVPAGFSYDASSTCLQNDDEAQAAATLNAGADCTLAIDFKPVKVGNNRGNVVVTDNSLSAGSPNYATQQIAVSGTGTQGTLTVGTLPVASSIAPGEPLSDSTLTNGVVMGADNTPIAGSFVWQNGATTFTKPGTYPETAVFNPTDATDYSPVTATVNVTVTAMGFAQSSLPAASFGVPYNQQISVSGGSAPYSYSITSGSLPVGMTLSSAGVLSGTPTTAGSYAFTLTVKDAKGFTASQNLVLNVAKGASLTTLSTSGSAANPDQGFTLTAHVASTLSGIAVAPTGTVSFYNNGALLGTATVTNGVASYTVAAPQAGATYVMTASYAGDANFAASTSAASSPVKVASLDFTIAVSGQSGSGGSSQTVVAGTAASYALSVTPTAGSYPGAVNFTVAGLPAGATASFSPANLAANAGAQTVKMTIQTMNPLTSQAENHNPFGRGTSIFLGSLVLPLLGLRRARKGWMKRGLLVALLVMGGLVGVTALTGCGTSSTVGNSFQPKSYTLTVTATSASVTHSTTVNLTVN